MGITLWQMLCNQTESMARTALSDVNALADWQDSVTQRRREFLHSLGLDPLPPRCDLQVTDYGGFQGQGYTARRIAFQLLPQCWSSANIYYPDPMPRDPAPAVVYVCGHATIGLWHYQYHPIMWARRGYVCIIVDTVEQHDNRGEHHGSLMGRFEQWISLGYTPAGVEVWNAMRAADVLCADPRVDGQRIGITGVSGGGSCSFHTAVADERFKAVSTLCGICSPMDAVCNRHVYGNCDCMFSHNVYGRDISEYAALIAPRAGVFCFAAQDPLFHLDETRALVERARKVWRLYGVEDKCQTVVADCPHGDHVDFDKATAACFDQHVAGRKHPEVPRGERDWPESNFCVFRGQVPMPDHCDLLPHLLAPRGSVPLPDGAGDWPAIRERAITGLLKAAPSLRLRPPAASFQRISRSAWGTNTCASGFRVMIDQLDAWLHVVTSSGEKKPAFVLNVAGEAQNLHHAMGGIGVAIDVKKASFGALEPRVAGHNSLPPAVMENPPGSHYAPVRSSIMRAMVLAGTTPVAITVQDLAATVEHLLSLDEVKGSSLYLTGSGSAAAAVLYYAIQDARIAGVILRDLPSSHLDGPEVLGVLRALDLPQAVGLMAPRKVAMVDRGHNNWTWPTRVYARLGCPERLINANSLTTALDQILA
jgi:hypothetical protein